MGLYKVLNSMHGLGFWLTWHLCQKFGVLELNWRRTKRCEQVGSVIGRMDIILEVYLVELLNLEVN